METITITKAQKELLMAMLTTISEQYDIWDALDAAMPEEIAGQNWLADLDSIIATLK